MMFRFVPLISAALAAEVQEDALSLLQLRAAKPSRRTPRRAPRRSLVNLQTRVAPACEPLSQEACEAAADRLGLELGGEGYEFAGDYGTKGCYTYNSGKYEGHIYYGTGGTDDQMSAAPTSPKVRPQEPLSQEACATVAEHLGLELGGEGYDFAGDYGTKGCYSYDSGKYEGHMYYGTGGTEDQMSAAPTSPKFRPQGWDCQDVEEDNAVTNTGLLPSEQQAAAGNGFCRLGILTDIEDSATVGTLVAKFEARCEEVKDPNTGLQLYSTVLCEQLRQTLAQGLDLDEQANSGGDGPQKLCAELRRLTQAHFDHASEDVDQTLQSKEVVTPCVADVDCNGHGSTADNDSKDGCVCECVDGWSGSDCSQEPEQSTTTQDVGKAVDDPHLTSVHGTHFDLYSSGKYTLLSVPRHASSSDADLLVTAYVEKIGERKNDLWIRRMTVSGKWVGEHYSFKTSSGSFNSEGTHLVRIGHGGWLSPAAAQAAKPASFRVIPHKKHKAPTQDFSQSISDRVELQCGPVKALIRWATVQKNGEDVNHIDFRMSGLHDLGEDVGGLLVDEFDAE